MAFEPTPEQALALFSMIFGRTEEEQHPTKKQLGLTATSRASLVARGFLEFETVAPRVERASLTEEAWGWASDHLDARLPAKPRIWQATLGGVLARLREHLESSNESLAMFAPGGELPTVLPPKKRSNKESKRSTATAKKKKSSARRAAKRKTRAPKKRARSKRSKTLKMNKGSRSKPKSSSKPKKLPQSKHTEQLLTPQGPTNRGNGVLATRIRDTSLALGNGSARVRVRLHDLRVRLGDVSREDLDRELIALQLRGALVLYRIDDPTDISRDDASAAVSIAGHPRHILYLEH